MRNMARLTARRIWMVFAGLFVVALCGVFAFEYFYRAPGQRCEANGGWWDMAERVCGRVIYIPDITGRAEGESRESASRRGPPRSSSWNASTRPSRPRATPSACVRRRPWTRRAGARAKSVRM